MALRDNIRKNLIPNAINDYSNAVEHTVRDTRPLMSYIIRDIT